MKIKVRNYRINPTVFDVKLKGVILEREYSDCELYIIFDEQLLMYREYYHQLQKEFRIVKNRNQRKAINKQVMCDIESELNAILMRFARDGNIFLEQSIPRDFNRECIAILPDTLFDLY